MTVEAVDAKQAINDKARLEALLILLISVAENSKALLDSKQYSSRIAHREIGTLARIMGSRSHRGVNIKVRADYEEEAKITALGIREDYEATGRPFLFSKATIRLEGMGSHNLQGLENSGLACLNPRRL